MGRIILKFDPHVWGENMEWFCTYSFRCNVVISGRQASTEVAEVSAALIMKLFIYRDVTGSKFLHYIRHTFTRLYGVTTHK